MFRIFGYDATVASPMNWQPLGCATSCLSPRVGTRNTWSLLAGGRSQFVGWTESSMRRVAAAKRAQYILMQNANGDDTSKVQPLTKVIGIWVKKYLILSMRDMQPQLKYNVSEHLVM